MVFFWLQAQHARLQRLGGVWTLGEHVLDALAPVLHLADVPHWLALFLATYGLPHGPQPAPLAALVARGVALGQPFDTVCAWTASLPPMMRPAAFDTVVATLPRADVLALWDWLLEFDDYPAELQADASPRVHALVQVMQRVPALGPSLVLDRIQRTLDRAAHMDWQDAVTLLLAMAPAVRHLHGENSTRVVVDALRERVLANPLPG